MSSSEIVRWIWCKNCGQIDIQAVFVTKDEGGLLHFSCPACETEGYSQVTVSAERPNDHEFSGSPEAGEGTTEES